MDDSVANIDSLEKSLTEKVKARRRSSFFGKSNVDAKSVAQCSDLNTSLQKTFDNYFEKLKSEKTEWKQTLEQLKVKYQELKKKRMTPKEITNYENFLTDEDKEFKKNRPSFAKFDIEVDNLKELAILVAVKKRKVENMTNESLQWVDRKMKTIELQICLQNEDDELVKNDS